MKVFHKKANIILTIKKDYGSVVSCYREEKDFVHLSKTLIVDTCVCLKQNLIPIKNQLTLF